MSALNETHDSTLTSWVVSANDGLSDFPIQNLPFAVFRRADSEETFRGGVAIGDQIVDLAALAAMNLFDGDAQRGVQACAQGELNSFMAMGPAVWSALRLALSRALRSGAPEQKHLTRLLVAQCDAEYRLPCRIGDYTDFYTSIHHATAVGALFRPENPLLPNYKWVPIGYHGRASSIGVSGQRFPRPKGQTKAPEARQPSFGPCQRLDYELEVGIYIGPANALGEPVSLARADAHIFGLCLFNDWSARDIQAWEYQPLGPFLAKNFASTISPWIVTNEALLPFRTRWQRDENDPQPLPYLMSTYNSAQGGYDIELEVLLQTAQMRCAGQNAQRLSVSNFKHSYWTAAQMLTHHTANGCNLQPGDFFGSGTQSGPVHEEAGSLLELTFGGKQAVTLANGEVRTFLADGDTVVLRGWCQKPGATRIGFGDCVGTVLPAKK